MKPSLLLSLLCMMSCAFLPSCRSSAPSGAESGGISEVLEIEGCTLSVPYVRVTPDMLETLPEAVRDKAEKYCRRSGSVVVVSGMRPRYFRLIRRQERLLLGSDGMQPGREVVYLSVIDGLGEAAGSIRSIKVENPDSPDPWDLGVFLNRYPRIADRINELPPGDGRLADLRLAARELLSRGSTRVLLERHSRKKDPAALDAAVQAEQEQIGVLEEILNAE